jgi:hypothetical protein
VSAVLAVVLLGAMGLAQAQGPGAPGEVVQREPACVDRCKELAWASRAKFNFESCVYSCPVARKFPEPRCVQAANNNRLRCQSIKKPRQTNCADLYRLEVDKCRFVYPPK